MTQQTIIFEEPAERGPYRGKVWRDDAGNYGTYGAGHSLCVEMAKEIERLRSDAERYRTLCESSHELCFMGQTYTSRAEFNAAIDKERG